MCLLRFRQLYNILTLWPLSKTLRYFYSMRFVASFIVVAGIALVMLFGASCKKQRMLTTGGVLKFSVDTLKFDTVFTAAGSYTNWVLIYNPQNEEVTLSSVRLQNGANSYFHLNVDGFKGNNVPNIKIAPHDSVYVFATVNINPSDTLTPFIVTDQLIATLNGKDFSIPFTAFGQNAHYIIGDSLSVNTNWLTDKPYVVIHTCVVGPNCILNIPRGCRVYMHQDAQFVIYNTLNVGLTPSSSPDSVVFQGDRLDRAYFGYIGYPGEWGGLWFVSSGISTGNISHAVFKNCGGGVQYYYYSIIPAAIRVDTTAVVNMDHTVIENSISLGILGFQGTVNGSNCLVKTTGGQALAISLGGTDSFVNCTFVNYGTGQVNHASAATVAILDYYSPDAKNFYYSNLNAVLRNCIVYGSLDSEIICDTSFSPAGTKASLTLDNCLLKMGTVREPFVHFNSCIFNKDPQFRNSAGGDFHISAASPAAGAGLTTPGIITDLEGKNWASPPDIGCYRSE